MSTRWLNFTIALSAALMTLDMTVVTIALPEINASFSVGLRDAQWVVNSYVLVFAALLLGVGALSDHIPRRPLFLIGHVVFGLASLLCTVATGIDMLILGRVIQALGATLVFATCMPLIADHFEGDDVGRSRAVGIYMAAGAAAAALGPLVGGFIVSNGGWRWMFAINPPLCLLAIAIMFFLVRSPEEKTQAGGRIDWISMTIIAAALFSLNYALISGSNDSWTTPLVLGAFVVAAILLGVFIILQIRYGHEALLDLSLFKSSTFTAAITLSFTARLVSYGMMPYLVFWLAGYKKLSPIAVGLVLLAMALPIVMIAGPSSALQKTGKVNIVTGAAMLLVTAGLIWLGRVASPEAPWALVIGPLIVIGAGTGLAMPHMMNIALSVVPASRSGSATGVVNTAFPLGTATGVASFGVILNSHMDALEQIPESARTAGATGQLNALQYQEPADIISIITETFADGLSTIMFTAALCSALCAAFCWWAIRLPRPAVESQHP